MQRRDFFVRTYEDRNLIVIEKNGIAARNPDRNIGGIAGRMAEIITDTDPGFLEIDQKGLVAFLSAISNRLEKVAEVIVSK